MKKNSIRVSTINYEDAAKIYTSVYLIIHLFNKVDIIFAFVCNLLVFYDSENVKFNLKQFQSGH